VHSRFIYFFGIELALGQGLSLGLKFAGVDPESGVWSEALWSAGYLGLLGILAIVGPIWVCALVLVISVLGVVVGLIGGSLGATTAMGVNALVLVALLEWRRTAARGVASAG
jgi:hypothetical protein